MGCYKASDGYLNVAAPYGRLLEQFAAAIGLPDLPNDPRFDSTPKRSENRTELNALITQQLSTRTTAEWVDLLNAAGVPSGPVYGIDAVFADPQVEFLEMATPVQHKDLGPIDLIRNPVRMDGTTTPLRMASPDAGEHTDEILAEIGWAPASSSAGFSDQ